MTTGGAPEEEEEDADVWAEDEGDTTTDAPPRGRNDAPPPPPPPRGMSMEFPIDGECDDEYGDDRGSKEMREGMSDEDGKGRVEIGPSDDDDDDDDAALAPTAAAAVDAIIIRRIVERVGILPTTEAGVRGLLSSWLTWLATKYGRRAAGRGQAEPYLPRYYCCVRYTR